MKSLHRITLALVAAAGALALSTAAFARPALSAGCAQSSGAGQDGAATQAADCARTGVPVVTGGGNDLRISQVYGGGGGSSGYYLYDYVELFNAGTSSADLTGHSLQYGSYNGNFGSSSSNIFAFPAGTTLAAGKYLLVQLGTAGTGGIALPVTPDAVTTNLNMGATRGKVALASIATALGCGATATPCALPHADIIDLAAYGGSNNGEGGTSINNGVNLTNQQGGVRKSDGCQDTDDNNADFDVLDGAALVPRNGASPAHSCGGPVTHTVTSSVGTPSGTITPLGAQTVNEGDTIAFTLAADPGYAIDNVASTCGGTLDGGTGVFTTAAITADCTVTANFAPITWTVTSSVGTPSGTITPSGAQTVNEGGTLTFTLTADPGYEIDTVGGSCGGTLTGNSFETDPVTADCDVIANFKAAGGNPDIVCTAFNHPVMQTSNGTYINWETGAWSDTGSLSGAHFNPYGSSNLTFFWPTPTTNAGVTSGGTFAVLSLGDTIGASSTFARSGAPTAWRAGADGYLGFSFACSTASVCYGYMHFTTTGPSGYPATMGDYCWNKAGDPITIAVPGPFLTVTPSVGVGSGAISPSTPQSVNVGGTKTFTLAPAAGFHTLSVTGTCGGTLTGNSFTTDPVTADCTVVANFEANPSAAITPASLALSAVQGASDNGAINIANVGGGTLTYSITESPARLPTIPTAMDSPVVQSRDAQPSRAYAPRPNPQPQAVVIDEGFEDVAGLLGAGWITANHSSPMGAATWAQCGGTAIPPAFDGDPNSCALVNYTSTTGTGTISNWLLTPEISFNGGSTASFYTRTSSGAPYADRLEVRVCSSGDCTDFGTGATDVGNFTTLLLTINPGLQSGPDATGVNGYPDTWTQFTLSGLPTSGTGRIAFRYFVTDGGPSGSNSNIIGIDRLVVDNGAPGGCAMPTDIPWMSVAPGSGAIAAGTNEDVTVTADATGLAVGTYTADVCVATNDPVTPVTAVPVSFTVTSSAIAPTLGKTFAPDTVLVNESSVATLTLSNANATDAVLTAPLVDTLPAGLNVTAATTTCLLGVGGSMPAPMASVTLPAGAKIPANGSCTVSITVSTPTPGSYVNTIAAGALQTDLGSNAAEATATLTVNPLPPPLATFTPGSFSFTVQADQTTSGTLNIANAAGRDVLSYSIDAREVLRPVARASGLSKRASAPRVNLQPARLVSSGRSGGSASAQPLYNPLASYTFQLDDGTYENSVGFVDSGPPAVEWGAVWINRFNVTEALTIDSISIMWPTNPEGTLVGMQPNLVVYYDADADGDPTNAQRIGTDQLVTIAALDVFETYTTNFAVPGAGDVYVGFVDQWSLNGYSPGLYPAALDETASQGMSWLAVAGTPPADVDNLGNNDMIGTIDDFAMPGNWLIRATGTSGAPTTCTGAVVGWMSASPASGTVNSGADTDVTITVDPSAGGLVPGSYSAELCITSNDPTQPLVAIPVSVTVTEPPVPFCNGGADEVFCDGFESAAGGDIVSGTINQPLVQDGDGNTFDFVTGQFGVYDVGRVDDINIYDFGSGMYVYWYGDMAALAVGGVVDSGGTEFAVLHSGDTIGPGSTISAASLAMTNWLGGTDGYIGIAFENEDTGQLNYGYIRMTTTASSGYPAQWLEYAYDRTGAAITIP